MTNAEVVSYLNSRSIYSFGEGGKKEILKACIYLSIYGVMLTWLQQSLYYVVLQLEQIHM